MLLEVEDDERPVLEEPGDPMQGIQEQVILLIFIRAAFFGCGQAWTVLFQLAVLEDRIQRKKNRLTADQRHMADLQKLLIEGKTGV